MQTGNYNTFIECGDENNITFYDAVLLMSINIIEEEILNVLLMSACNLKKL